MVAIYVRVVRQKTKQCHPEPVQRGEGPRKRLHALPQDQRRTLFVRSLSVLRRIGMTILVGALSCGQGWGGGLGAGASSGSVCSTPLMLSSTITLRSSAGRIDCIDSK
jgi:hypothetical protein